MAITWTDAPENQYPILGSDYSVKCHVTASPPPTVDWLRNGDPVNSILSYYKIYTNIKISIYIK